MSLSSSIAAAVICLCFDAGTVHAQTQPQSPPPLWATIPDVPALPAADTSGFVDHDGARLYYAVFNPRAGSPVLLLHGGFSASDSWGFEVPKLMANHTVIVMDTRGHGRSSRPDGAPLTYEMMEADALAVLDAVHVKRTSVVGLSDGGIVGLMLAIDHPDTVDKLFVWGANFNTHSDKTTPPDPAMKGMGGIFMAKMEAQYRRLSPTPDGFSALKTVMNATYASEPNLTPADLGRIHAPTVVADGEYEQFIAPEHTQLLARSIPGARLVIIPKVSHGGPQQDPVAFHQAVASLLDGK